MTSTKKSAESAKSENRPLSVDIFPAGGEILQSGNRNPLPEVVGLMRYHFLRNCVLWLPTKSYLYYIGGWQLCVC